MAKVKALRGGRWKVAPGTSLDVEKNSVYEIQDRACAMFLVENGVAEFVVNATHGVNNEEEAGQHDETQDESGDDRPKRGKKRKKKGNYN